MATFRTRGDSCTAIVRKKQGGKLVLNEYRTFTGARAEPLARDWAKRLEATILRDGVPQRAVAKTTLGGLLRTHIAAIGNTSSSKASELARLADEFDKVPLVGMRPAVFSEFATRRRASGASPSTVLHNLSTVRGVLSVARVMYDLDVDGAVVKEAMAALTKMKVIAVGQPRTRRPSGDELSQLDDHFAAKEDHVLHKIPMRKMMWLAIELPRRIGELTAMRWVDLNDNVVTLRDTKHPTTPRTEHIPVLPAAAKIIATLPRTAERICPFVSESVSMTWRRACARLDIEDLHFHDLRREGVSRLFKAGYSIPEVAKISGHLDWAMLKIYTDIRPQDILEKFA